jgi:hypothetical protein
MGHIDADLSVEWEKNDHVLYIVEADDLIAAWCFQKRNRLKRSYDFSRVPTEFRYSAPPSSNAPLLPCHVTFNNDKAGGARSVSCHQGSYNGMRLISSINHLEAIDFAKRNVAPYVSPIMDAHTLAIVIKDLGITGKASPKIIKGRQYIVLCGYPGHRMILRGTVYSSQNAKIIQMALGAAGIHNMVKSGARLTIYLTVPLSILQCILEDEMMMSSLVGRTTSDLIKLALSSIAMVLVGVVIGKVIAVAAAPIFAAIVVGLVVSWELDAIDRSYGLTEKLVKLFENRKMKPKGTSECCETP